MDADAERSARERKMLRQVRASQTGRTSRARGQADTSRHKRAVAACSKRVADGANLAPWGNSRMSANRQKTEGDRARGARYPSERYPLRYPCVPRARDATQYARAQENPPCTRTRVRPRDRSTGPTTAAGKAVVARNACRGGNRAKLQQLRRSLRAQRAELDSLLGL